MTEAEVVQAARQYFESLFPKTCPNCSRRFATLREYILITKRIGTTKSYDAELGDWKTTQPLGSVAMANCPCGSMLALSTEGMALSQRLALLNWVRIETQRRGISPSDLLESLRDEVRKQVLDEPIPGDTVDVSSGLFLNRQILIKVLMLLSFIEIGGEGRNRSYFHMFQGKIVIFFQGIKRNPAESWSNLL
jgi:hypothetical protein